MSTRTAPANNRPADNGYGFPILQWIFQTAVPTVHPEMETRKFLTHYNTTFSADHPTFMEGSYQTAVEQAYRQNKLLLIYIHSPLHQDTEQFSIEVMCSDAFREYVNRNFLCWAGSISDMEAYSLSLQLKTTTFPFLAVFACQSQRTVQIADKIEGHECLDAAGVLARMNIVMSRFAIAVERRNQQERQRTEAMSLRAQQDQEYEAAMEQDRQAMLRQEEEEREAQQRAQAEELEKAIELSKELDHLANINKLREKLPPEPEIPAAASGSSSSKSPADKNGQVAVVRFQLPQSCKASKLQRRFNRTDTVQTLYDYLSVYFHDEKTGIVRFVVSTNFPKQDLTDMSQTMEDVGVFPRGALFVTDLDA